MKHDFNNLIYIFILCIYEYFARELQRVYDKKSENIYKLSEISFTKIGRDLFKHLGQICLGRAK